MIDKEKLLPTLEAIKELKAEYYVGSQAAFFYLKERRWLEEVSALAVTCLGSDMRDHPLIRSFRLKTCDWIVYAVHHVIELLLEAAAFWSSTPDDYSFATDHWVLHPTRALNPNEVEERTTTYYWKIDNYPEAIGNVLRALVEQEFVEPMIPNRLEDLVEIVMDVTEDYLWQDKVKLTQVVSGETITFSQFLRHAKYRSLSREMIDQFEEERREKDRKSFHDKSRDWAAELSFNIGRPAMLADHLIDLGRIELLDSDDWLYDIKLYERAEREYTLGYREIERRIALTDIFQYSEGGLLPEDRVNLALKKSKEHLEEMKRIVKEQSRIFSEADVQRLRYQYLAILQNKKWLIEFLSR